MFECFAPLSRYREASYRNERRSDDRVPRRDQTAEEEEQGNERWGFSFNLKTITSEHSML